MKIKLTILANPTYRNIPMAAPSIQDSASSAVATGIPMNNPMKETQADKKLTRATFLADQPDASKAAISPIN